MCNEVAMYNSYSIASFYKWIEALETWFPLWEAVKLCKEAVEELLGKSFGSYAKRHSDFWGAFLSW